MCHGWLVQPCLLLQVKHGWTSQPWHLVTFPYACYRFFHIWWKVFFAGAGMSRICVQPDATFGSFLIQPSSPARLRSSIFWNLPIVLYNSDDFIAHAHVRYTLRSRKPFRCVLTMSRRMLIRWRGILIFTGHAS